MGGFTSTAATVGRTLLGPALTAYSAYSDFQDRSSAVRSAQTADLAAARQAEEDAARKRTEAEAEAQRLRIQAEAEALWRSGMSQQTADLERRSAEAWNAYHITTAEREAALADSQGRAAATAEQRRLEAEAAEAERLREADLKRAQASARARFGAAGLRDSTSAAALLTGMADETAARSAAAGQRTAASVSDLWAQVERQRDRNLLTVAQTRQHALLTMGDLSARHALDAAQVAHENELALYRAGSAANRLLADAWTQTRQPARTTSGSGGPSLVSTLLPVAQRLLSTL